MLRSLSIACLLAATLLAMPAQAEAQVLQLPTYRYFSTNSSVLVPDRGAAYLGGVGHAAYGSSRRGPFSRSAGSSVGNSGISVHATIIDHAEWDRALLAEAAARRGDKVDVLGRAIDSNHKGSNPSGSGGIRLGADSGNSPAAATTSQRDAIRRKAAFLSEHVSKSGSRR